MKNRNKDMDYISSKLEKGSLSSESILFLFDMIGHDTSFHRNGEFSTLFSTWYDVRPAIIHIKNSETLEDAKSIFTGEVQRRYNIEKVYKAFKEVEE